MLVIITGNQRRKKSNPAGMDQRRLHGGGDIEEKVEC